MKTSIAPLYSTRVLIAILLVVFLLTFCFFLFLQAEPVFPDPDSFYHMKMAELISERGVVEEFPWLAFTGLTYYFTDQHFLYHVFLAPFVTFFDPVFGVKLATVVINAAFFTLCAAFLIRFSVRWWWVFLVVLLVTNPFLFRINLVKAPGLSLILLCGGLWLLFSRRVRPLALLAFVYVWAYGGFVLLGVLGVVYGAASAMLHWHRTTVIASVFRRITPRRPHGKGFVWTKTVLPVVAIGAGLALGLLINPYFPKNLFFYWQQLVQIGIVNFQDVVNVGGEWHPYGFVELLANTVFVSIAVLLGLVTFFVARRRQSAESWALLLLTVFFFIITLKSRRYVELYVPFAVFFSAFALRDGVTKPFRELVSGLWGLLGRRVVLTALLAVYIFGVGLMVILRDERQLLRDLRSGFRSTELRAVSLWIAEHTPENSIVVHSDWDEFPILFAHNTHNRYIVGLDPTFMYQYDKLLYQRWADLTSGIRSEGAEQIITQDLQSSTVLVTKDHPAFDRIMAAQQAFVLSYEDDEAKVYQLQSPPRPILPPYKPDEEASAEVTP